MQYLILLRFPEGAGPQEGTPELDAEMERWGALNEELKAAVADLDAAIGWALKMPSAEYGSIEIEPLHRFSAS